MSITHKQPRFEKHVVKCLAHMASTTIPHLVAAHKQREKFKYNAHLYTHTLSAAARNDNTNCYHLLGRQNGNPISSVTLFR